MSHRIRPARACAAALSAALLLSIPAPALAKRHKPRPPRGTKVTIDLLAGSAASVTIPPVALPGGTFIIGTEDRDPHAVPISGRFRAVVPGGFKLGKSNRLTLQSGRVGLGAADLLADAACGGAPVLRLDPASFVTLDPAAPSTGRITSAGHVTATVHLLLRLAVQSRVLPGCDAGLVSMGYATSAFTLKLKGDIAGAGLTNIQLVPDGSPADFSAAVCLAPGSPTTPCVSPPAGYPVGVGVDAHVKVTLPGA